jgi:serine/threonine protein kinase
MVNYITLKELGSGSFGSVYLVKHPKTGQKFAIKIIENSNSSTAQQEVEILKRTKHEYIIKYFNSYKSTAGKLCIVLEYAESGTFESVFGNDGGGCTDQHYIWRAISHIASALSYLHNLRVSQNLTVVILNV